MNKKPDISALVWHCSVIIFEWYYKWMLLCYVNAIIWLECYYMTWMLLYDLNDRPKWSLILPAALTTIDVSSLQTWVCKPGIVI